MSGKTILITGGRASLGALTARRILRQTPGRKIVLTDILHHPRTALLAEKVAFVSADLSDPRACLDLLTPDTSAVYHFASLVSGGAERDFVAGLNANVRATINLLEACRERGACRGSSSPAPLPRSAARNCVLAEFPKGRITALGTSHVRCSLQPLIRVATPTRCLASGTGCPPWPTRRN